MIELTLLRISLMISSKPDLMIRLRTDSIYTRGFRMIVVRILMMMGALATGALVTVMMGARVMGARVTGLRRWMMDILTTAMRRTLFTRTTVMKRTLFTTDIRRTSITNRS